MKTLYFERAGMDHYEQSDLEFSDVGNHRIRTAFRNDKGERIYLELNHSRVEKKDKRSFHQGYPTGQLIAWVDFCFWIDKKHPKYEKMTGQNLNLPCERTIRFVYTLDEILKFVNKEIGCSFDKVEILDEMEWYHVHGVNGTYNMMEDHEVNPERTEARKELKKSIEDYYRAKLDREYPPISISKVDGDNLTVHIHASDQAMRKAGIKLRDIDYTLEGWYTHVTQ